MDGTGPENRPECFHEQGFNEQPAQGSSQCMINRKATICREHLIKRRMSHTNTALAYLSQNGTTLAQEQPASLM
jgi:hypothetical protein